MCVINRFGLQLRVTVFCWALVWALGLGRRADHPSFHPTDQAGNNSGQMAATHFSAQLATLFGTANHVKFGDEFQFEITRFNSLRMRVPAVCNYKCINQLRAAKCRGYAHAANLTWIIMCSFVLRKSHWR